MCIYGSESWFMTQKSAEQLNVFESNILRWILGLIKENGIQQEVIMSSMDNGRYLLVYPEEDVKIVSEKMREQYV